MHWYDVLKSVRRISSAGEITSSVVADDTDLTPALASAWLGKFTRWGYLVRVGVRSGHGRPRTVYQLTSWGKRFSPARKAEATLRKVANNPKKKVKDEDV